MLTESEVEKMKEILEKIPEKIKEGNLPGVVADFKRAMDLLEKIVELEKSQAEKPLALEDHNFRVVNSDGWEKITVGGEEYLLNPKGDVWQINSGKFIGEQLFTHGAAKRETQRAGKRMPTDEEFSKILKTKEDMPNLILAGYRRTGGSFTNRLTYTYFWSSSQYGASNAWLRNLNSGYSTVNRYNNNKAYGFSVRCLKD